jgi:hypothetical protein
MEARARVNLVRTSATMKLKASITVQSSAFSAGGCRRRFTNGTAAMFCVWQL